jgi:excisionase family DNA binding protein
MNTETHPTYEFPPIMTIDQAARYLSVAPQTIFRWRRRKHNPLPAAKVHGGDKGQVRIVREDLDRWIRSQIPVPESEEQNGET